jgi:uncharacterized protein YndB with AHSA1/START domain
MSTLTTAPIGVELEVNASRAKAFDVFVNLFGDWWPLETHSIQGRGATEAIFEGRVGGRIYERNSEGKEGRWGRVLVWEPPRRIVFSWNPNPDRAEETEVEIVFEEVEGRTRVKLEHRGWERLRPQDQAIREGYATGWNPVLDRFAARVQAEQSYSDLSDLS